MKKKTFKVGVASLAVTAMLASASVTDVFAASPAQDQNKEWKSTIVQRIMDQFELIQKKHNVTQSPIFATNEFKVILDSAFTVIEKELKPILKPVVTPVKPEEKPVTTPEVKPEEKPVTTPEVKPEEKPVVTPEVKPEEKPVVTPAPTPTPTPEVKPEEKPVVTPEDNTDKTDDNTFSAEQQQVLALVNEERAAVGLQPLVLDAAVSKVATEKARDMQDNNYFSHQSPTYGSPFDMLTQFGVKYSYAGENIAYGQRNAEEVMTAWMNSTGHRQNILGANFTKIGIGYVGNKWVQLFIG